MSLEMVSSIERLFASGDFSIWRGADRTSQKRPLPWILGRTQKGRNQHRQLSSRQTQADDSDDQFQRQTQPRKFSPLIRRSKQPDAFASARPIQPKQFLGSHKRTARATANDMH